MRLWAAVSLAAIAPAWAADWIRLSAPDVEIATDAGERAARQVLDRLDQIRRAVPGASGPARRALRLIVFASDREFRTFAPDSASSGFYRGGPERDYAALAGAAGFTRVVAHEYVHFLLHQQPRTLPGWLEEGLAEFYSNAAVDRGRARLGAAIEEHATLLRRGAWLDAGELRSPPAADENERRGSLYYAQSWALVHMLRLAPAYRGGVDRLIALLDAGQDEPEAFQAVFGRTLETALAELKNYAAAGFRTVTVEAPPAPERAAPALERLDELQALLLRGELALAAGRRDTAKLLFERAARGYPEAARAVAGLGALALAEGDRAAARAHLERAASLDAADGGIWFQYALIEQESGAGLDRVTELLHRAVALNPDLGEARLLLGVRATDAGDLETALVHLRAAARLLPRRSYVWHALAFAELKRGDTAAAAVSARQALRTAVNPQQERMARALLETLE
jgi:tetratricopeptide (TPR) repeat protein